MLQFDLVPGCHPRQAGPLSYPRVELDDRVVEEFLAAEAPVGENPLPAMFWILRICSLVLEILLLTKRFPKFSIGYKTESYITYFRTT